MPSTAVKRALQVVAAIIHHPDDPDLILLGQRKPGQYLENLWEFPGGKLEPGESRFHGLRRELEEEVGIYMNAAHPFITVKHRYPEKTVLLDTWRITGYTGIPHSKEGQKLQWVNISSVDQYTMPAADVPIVQALSLPEEILITPDVDLDYVDSFIEQFSRVMRQHPYRLVSFRAQALEDADYVAVANKLQEIARSTNAALIIHRPTLSSLRSKRFDTFAHRHLTSQMIHDVRDRLDRDQYQWSASCHDLTDLRKAHHLGCRFAYLSCVRQSERYPGRLALGWQGFAARARGLPLPVYATGGVRRSDLSSAQYQGAVGVAGVRDFWSA